MPLNKDVDLSKIAKQTEGYVGADIESLCREAAILALRENIRSKEVKMDNFLDALKKVGGSVDPEDAKKYKEVEEAYLKAARSGEVKKNELSYMG
jgi:transitional endoplasmic reticulum ATPase